MRYPEENIKNINIKSQFMKSILVFLFITSVLFLHSCFEVHDGSKKYIINNTDWKDSDNNPILAHDGGISRFNNIYYWYGCNYSNNPDGKYGVNAFNCKVNHGTNVYSSTDLINWKYEGIAMESPEKLKGLSGKGSIHRPHVIFNAKTGKYVMWFFYFKDVYPDIMSSVAVSDKPTGPFAFVGTVETGSPAITGIKSYCAEQKTEGPAGCSQDLNVFVDSDNSAYLVYDDGKRNIRVDKLADDYLSSTKVTVIALSSEKNSHEGPAMIKFKGKYIVAGSGVKGWGPSPTYYAVADKPMGPYSPEKLLTYRTNLNTWNSQLTSFIYIPENDKLIAMCNQWWIPDVNDLNKSRYLWIEVVYHNDPNEFEMSYSDTLFTETKERVIK